VTWGRLRPVSSGFAELQLQLLRAVPPCRTFGGIGILKGLLLGTHSHLVHLGVLRPLHLPHLVSAGG
jgi:hypothetical protein